VASRAADLVTDDPLAAIRLCEMVFAVDPRHDGALRTYLAAHETLAAEHARENYWLTHWIEGEITGTRHRLER
jgi:hypothetical protein